MNSRIKEVMWFYKETVIVILTTIMHFLKGISKTLAFSTAVNSFKYNFLISGLPKVFYSLSTLIIILVEIIAPICIVYSSLFVKMESLAKNSCYMLAGTTLLSALMYNLPKNNNYADFLRSLTMIGGLLALSELYNY